MAEFEKFGSNGDGGRRRVDNRVSNVPVGIEFFERSNSWKASFSN